MGSIGLEDVRPGMVVAGDVRDTTGRLLLRAGQEVTERALRVLRMWGVAEVDVEGAGAARALPAADTGDEASARVRDHVDRLFQHADGDHAFVAELKKVALRRLARRRGTAWPA